MKKKCISLLSIFIIALSLTACAKDISSISETSIENVQEQKMSDLLCSLKEITVSRYWTDNSENRSEEVKITAEEKDELIKALDYENKKWLEDVTKLEPDESYVIQINDDLSLYINHSTSDDRWFMDEKAGGVFTRETLIGKSLISFLSGLFDADY